MRGLEGGPNLVERERVAITLGEGPFPLGLKSTEMTGKFAKCKSFGELPAFLRCTLTSKSVFTMLEIVH